MSNKTMANIKTEFVNGRERVVDGYEFFYEDENGNLQDADIHEPILAECDEKALARHDIERAKKLGLTRFLAHMRKHSPEHFIDD